MLKWVKPDAALFDQWFEDSTQRQAEDRARAVAGLSRRAERKPTRWLHCSFRTGCKRGGTSFGLLRTVKGPMLPSSGSESPSLAFRPAPGSCSISSFGPSIDERAMQDMFSHDSSRNSQAIGQRVSSCRLARTMRPPSRSTGASASPEPKPAKTASRSR